MQSNGRANRNESERREPNHVDARPSHLVFSSTKAPLRPQITWAKSNATSKTGTPKGAVRDDGRGDEGRVMQGKKKVAPPPVCQNGLCRPLPPFLLFFFPLLLAVAVRNGPRRGRRPRANEDRSPLSAIIFVVTLRWLLTSSSSSSHAQNLEKKKKKNTETIPAGCQTAGVEGEKKRATTVAASIDFWRANRSFPTRRHATLHFGSMRSALLPV